MKLYALAFASCLTPCLAYGLPEGGAVSAGVASINQPSASQLQITQGSTRAVIDWRSFNVAAGEAVNITQPGASAVLLNRIQDQQPSQIYGNLTANGQVILANPNGMVFGPSSRVDVAGLIATTAQPSTSRFMEGNELHFDEAGKADASIINHGQIRVRDGGLAVLVAPQVVNAGSITARAGKVTMAAGDRFAVDLYGDGLLSLEATPAMSRALVSQQGKLEGGLVTLSVADAKHLVDSTINLNGIIEADSLSVDGSGAVLVSGGQVRTSGGTINAKARVIDHTGVLDASGTTGGQITLTADAISQQGEVRADGTSGRGGNIRIETARAYIDSENSLVSASSTQAEGGRIAVVGQSDSSLFASGQMNATGQRGGSIQVTAPAMKLYGARMDASGTEAGGKIDVGGEYQGGGKLPHAKTVDVNFSSTLKADVTQQGAGGEVVVWSDERTRFAGTASARGEGLGGEGGRIEVSSKDSLEISRAAKLDVSSPFGLAGQVLLDPKNITIASGGINGLSAFELVDPNFGTANRFGSSVAALTTGNVVVIASEDDFAATDAGAVYLFNGGTGALISTLRGSSSGDFSSGGYITALTNGNYVVTTPNWDNGTATNAGAATWGSGITGISGTISATNSLVGTTDYDGVGGGGITALTNGNYVVNSYGWNNGAATSAGAATWGNGTTGISGTISATNSLVGTSADDNVGIDTQGNSTIFALANGNYVVGSGRWDNGAATDAGAVTWGNGTTGISGTISATNSLVGTTADDRLGIGDDGSHKITLLTNGNYVVGSGNWDDGATTDAGAATWGSGATGISGTISAANSLVGTTAGDRVGQFGITALTNGNYVIRSPEWNNGAVIDAGAATWGNGTTGITGTVSAANSLVGTTASDYVGISGITALTNGNYVVSTYLWDNGAVIDAGAATWGNGNTGISGTVSAANSLVGTAASDYVGSRGITALTNGNYVVGSENWDNGGATNAGAATWGNGNTGISGTVSAANSLVGSSSNDYVSYSGVTALTNGNYVVASREWNNGTAIRAGAATWGNGTTGIIGAVSSTNSLVGTSINDLVGSDAIAALTNGNYVVLSSAWNNGANVNVGAATWGNGTTGISGTISATNSLVGTTAYDYHDARITALTNGNYVVSSGFWDNGAVIDAGAATWGDGTSGISGTISAAISLVGSSSYDNIGGYYGYGITALTNGNYVVSSDNWDNGAVINAGAATWGSGTAGVSGTITAANSIIGPTANAGLGYYSVTADTVNGTYLMPFIGSGRLFVRPQSGSSTLSAFDGFSDSPSASVTLDPVFLTATLNTGAAVTLQANNDITVASPITVNNSGGVGGHLTLTAGRSVLLNANITTDDGNLTLRANAPAALGTINAHRDAGAAAITMAPGTLIDAGAGLVTLILDSGHGLTYNSAGVMSLRNIVANRILANTATSTADIVLNGTLTANGTGDAVTLATAGDFINNAGAGALVTPAGRWLIYSEDPALNTNGGIVADSETLGCTYGGVCASIPVTGNHQLYRKAAPAPAPAPTVTPELGQVTSIAPLQLTTLDATSLPVTVIRGTSFITGSFLGNQVNSYRIGDVGGTNYLLAGSPNSLDAQFSSLSADDSFSSLQNGEDRLLKMQEFGLSDLR